MNENEIKEITGKMRESDDIYAKMYGLIIVILLKASGVTDEFVEFFGPMLEDFKAGNFESPDQLPLKEFGDYAKLMIADKDHLTLFIGKERVTDHRHFFIIMPGYIQYTWEKYIEKENDFVVVVDKQI